jgi:uncharacterized protein (TIGR04255 family)
MTNTANLQAAAFMCGYSCQLVSSVLASLALSKTAWRAPMISAIGANLMTSGTERSQGGKTLVHPPLVEAIFEAKWKLVSERQGFERDPHYELVLGILFERFRSEYRFHEALPSASMPASVLAGIVQHRFRKAEGEWPLVQLGPGVFTVNDTQGYSWSDFRKRALDGVATLLDAYPQPPEISSLALRYINATEFDFGEKNVLDFLRDSLKTDLALHRPLFDATGVERAPMNLNCLFTFRSEVPKGSIVLRFLRGKNKDRDALFWHTHIVSSSDELPDLPSGLGDWLGDSHDVLEDWFLKLTEGDLLRSYEGC